MNTGKWTKEEKERFIKGVYKYSKNWKKVSLIHSYFISYLYI